ncbi:MAG: hypothetical protein ABJL18_00995 [Hyphomicrobiales bacterium]
MFDKEKREFGGWWIWVGLLLVLTFIVGFALNAVGLIGKAVVERVVFEESYQRKAGDAAKLATFEAQRSSLREQLTAHRSHKNSAQILKRKLLDRFPTRNQV